MLFINFLNLNFGLISESSVQAEEKRARKACVSNLKGTDPVSVSKSGSIRNSKQRKPVSNDLCNTEAERNSPSSSVFLKRRQKASPAKVREAIYATKTCFYSTVVRIHDHVEAVLSAGS